MAAGSTWRANLDALASAKNGASKTCDKHICHAGPRVQVCECLAMEGGVEGQVQGGGGRVRGLLPVIDIILLDDHS